MVTLVFFYYLHWYYFSFLFQYPTTWYGLIMLLDDADLSSVADALESLAVEHPEAL